MKRKNIAQPPTVPSDDTPYWQTWWSIAGPKLPNEEIQVLSRVFIAPLSDQDFEQKKLDRHPIPTITGTTDSFVVRYPPIDAVQSRHRLQIDVQAHTADEATEKARDIANRLLSSLTLHVDGGRYHAQLRVIRKAGETTEYSAWSDTMNITLLLEPPPWEASELDRALTFMKAVEDDELAENAYIHLLSAWQLEATSGRKPLARSILQHYVLCMEAIVQGVMGTLRKSRADQIRADERRFASEFADDLTKRADKPAAIREASTKLRDISCINTLPAIKEVAEALGIADATAKAAMDLYRFRSRGLSHPGRTDPTELQTWLSKGAKAYEICRADDIARAFLAAYCDSLKLARR